MANYNTLKTSIAAVIKQNGNNEITGPILQQTLLGMVNSLGANYQFAGIATPSTNHGTPDQNVFYLASTAGTYANFGGLVLADGEIAILKWNGAWSKDSTGAASSEKLNQLGQDMLNRIINNDISTERTYNSTTSTNSYYPIQQVSLKKGHHYRVCVSSDSELKAQQFSIKLSEGLTTTLVSKNLSLNGNAWDGQSVYLDYTPSEDKTNIYIGHYIQALTTTNTVYVTVEDVSIEDSLDTIRLSSSFKTESGSYNKKSFGGIDIIAGHFYLIKVKANSSVSGTQMSVKLQNSDDSTYLTLRSNILQSTWNGDELLFAFRASEDKENLSLAHYISNVTTDVYIEERMSDISTLINSEHNRLLLDNNIKGINNSENGKRYISDGSLDSKDGMVASSDYIDVSGLGSHLIWIVGDRGSSAYWNFLCFYENDGTFISSVQGENFINAVQIPSNAAKIKVSFYAGDFIGIFDKDCSVIYVPSAFTLKKHCDDLFNVVDGKCLTLYKNEASVTTLSGNGNFYPLEGITLVKGQVYIIRTKASGIITGSQLTIKLSKSDGTTLITLDSVVVHPKYHPSWNGFELVYSYTPSENVYGVKLGHYYQNITTGVVITDSVELQIKYGDIVRMYEASKLEQQRTIVDNSDFKCLFFSDVHGSSKNVQRIIEFGDFYKTKLNCIINAGDTVAGLMTEGLSWYNNIIERSNVPVLTIPGNHDCWDTDGSFHLADAKDVYSLITAKVKEYVPSIVQPANAAENGYHYFYIDFGNVRVICLNAMSRTNDAMYYDSAQSEWFASVLEATKTTYHYYKAQNYGFYPYELQQGDQVEAVYSFDADLNSIQYVDGKIYAIRMGVIVVNHSPYKYGKAERVSDKDVNSFVNYYDNGQPNRRLVWEGIHLNEDAVSIVNTFISGGGAFICWLTGHLHVDNVLISNEYTGQLMVNINSARNNYKPDGGYTTDENNPDFDSFDYIGVDLRAGLLKVWRVGWHLDGAMRNREVFSYDYINKEVAS